jgi:hypothetical protein
VSSADFASTFVDLKQVLAPFAPRLLVKRDSDDDYYLDAPFSEKYGRELFFGAVQIRKNYVSLHLMPVYLFPELLDGVSAALRKRMQGKSCFNFRSVEPELLRELKELAARGFERLEAEGVV